MENQNNAEGIPSGQPDKIKEGRKAGGLLFTGSMFIGMAAGWYFGHMNIGMFAGMGIGFILMAVVILSDRAKRG
jgi:hypothetical protein